MKYLNKIIILLSFFSFTQNLYPFTIGDIPIQDEGRIKPLDTYARNHLLAFYGKRSITELDLSATDWLLNLVLNPSKGKNLKIFNIRSPEVVSSIFLDWDTNHKYSFNEIQIPVEIRWRSSSVSKYRFWRIYTGLKYSRLLSQKYKYKDQNSTFSTSDVFINRNQLGFTINIGYNTWNLGLYKSIVPFFNKNNKNLPVDAEQFKLGLVFYIL